MTAPECVCDQHGDFCPAHPTCACGCQLHAHSGIGGPCIGGKMNCHGCEGYRPAKLKRFEELDDDAIEHATLDELRDAYKALRTHHIEELSALWHKYITHDSHR